VRDRCKEALREAGAGVIFGRGDFIFDWPGACHLSCSGSNRSLRAEGGLSANTSLKLTLQDITDLRTNGRLECGSVYVELKLLTQEAQS